MTEQEFLTQFKKNLLVGGPKREEILRELQTHIHEMQAKELELLGDQKRLAASYNRTHIGLLSGKILFLLPVIAIIIQTVLKFLYLPSFSTIPFNLTDHIFSDLVGTLSWLLYYLVTIIVGLAISRMRQQARWVSIVLFVSLFFGVICSILNELFIYHSNTIFFPIVTTTLSTLFYGVIGCGIIIFFSPRQNHSLRLQQMQLEIQLLLGSLGIFVLLYNFLLCMLDEMMRGQWIFMGLLAVSMTTLGVGIIRRFTVWKLLRGAALKQDTI